LKLLPEDREILGVTVNNFYHGKLAPGVWYAPPRLCARVSKSVRMIHHGMKLIKAADTW
jgi:hypothetical protein